MKEYPSLAAAALLPVLLFHAPPAPAQATWGPVADATLESSSRYYDRARRQLFVYSRAVNGSEPLYGPLRLVVEDSTRAVLNPDGTTAAGEPFFILTDDPAARLEAGAATDRVRIDFPLHRGGFDYALRLENRLPVGQPPRVTLAGEPRQLAPGAVTTLTAGIIDPDGDAILAGRWASDCGTLTGQNLAGAVFTAPDIAGVCQVTLEVVDAGGSVASGTFSVVVAPDFQPSTDLLVRVLDQYGQPWPGVRVWRDGGGPVLTTDAAGRVDLPDPPDTSPITLTLAYTDDAFAGRLLLTFRDILPGAVTLVLDNPSLEGSVNDTVAEFTVRADGPVEQVFGPEGELFFSPLVSIRQGLLQDDGRFSLVVDGGNGFYGYAIDLDPAGVEETLAVALDHREATLALAGDPFDTLEIQGFRHGKGIQLAMLQSPDSQVTLPAGYPAHLFDRVAVAFGESVEADLRQARLSFDQRSLGALPDTLVPDQPALTVNVLDYGYGRPSWVEFELVDGGLGDMARVDLFRLVIRGFGQDGIETAWAVTGTGQPLGGNRWRIETPGVPGALADWAMVGPSGSCGDFFYEAFDVEIGALGIDPADGMPEAFALYQAGLALGYQAILVNAAIYAEPFSVITPPVLPTFDRQWGSLTAACQRPFLNVAGTRKP